MANLIVTGVPSPAGGGGPIGIRARIGKLSRYFGRATPPPMGGAPGKGYLPGGLIGLRTAVGGPGGNRPDIMAGWTWNYWRTEKLLHVPTVPPPIVYSAMHPIFIGPNGGQQGYTNTGPTSYFTGTSAEQTAQGVPSWPRFFKPYLLPSAFNKTSAQAVQGMGYWTNPLTAAINQPRPSTIPLIVQPGLGTTGGVGGRHTHRGSMPWLT